VSPFDAARRFAHPVQNHDSPRLAPPRPTPPAQRPADSAGRGDARPITRACWDALKRANGIRGSVSVRKLPWFAGTLAALHADGWGQSDIARMFGVTRERVRQWFGLFGLSSQFSGSRPRRWSWGAERFLPITPRSAPP